MKINLLTKICLIWGIFWGFLSISLFFLGLARLWHPPIMIVTFIIFIAVLAVILKKYQLIKAEDLKLFFAKVINTLKKDRLSAILIGLLAILGIFYLLGALAPEKEFDALWYHLTLPKIYLMDHYVHFIPGGLLYYSVMPRLSEMLYGLSLAIVPSGILAKLLHFSFGVFWLIITYQILREFFSRRLSLLLCLVIYSLAQVSTLSTTAYIDLIVSFYVAISLWGMWRYFKFNNLNYLYLSAIFMGFNLESKTYGLMIFAVMALVLFIAKKWKAVLIFIAVSLLMVLPYYLNAYLATGNPIYPVFSIQDSMYYEWIKGAANYKQWLITVWPTGLPTLIYRALVYSWTPIFGLIILVPFIIKKKIQWQIFGVFCLFFIAWSFLPVWEVRYLMVVLPIMAVLVGFVITKIKGKWFGILVGLLIIIGLYSNISFTWKHLKDPSKMVLGFISRDIYISEYIGSIWYTFYDANGFLANNTNKDDKILTVNYHNLFYLDRPFVDWSYFGKNSDSLDDIYNRLKSQNIKYITLVKAGPYPWKKYQVPEFNNYFELIWEDKYEGFSRYYYRVK